VLWIWKTEAGGRVGVKCYFSRDFYLNSSCAEEERAA
ncbi:unnamed protein product, partial [Allacma fusca]